MKKRFLNIAVLVGVCLLLVNCRFNATRSGMQADKEDGERVANKLFSSLADHNYKEADKLFGEELYKVTPVDTMHKIFDMTTKKLGEFKSNKLVDWETVDIAGTNARTEYLYIYEVAYDKYNAKVTVGMLKKDDEDDAKIVKYNIDSPGFLN